MENEITLTTHISKSDEERYLKLPFTVPENIKRLTVSYNYKRHKAINLENGTTSEEINIIDLGLYSPNEFIGASGSNRLKVSVGNHKSSEGYATVEIIPGTWFILAGAYHIETDGVDVFYKVTFWEKELELFYGDTHAHTKSSDGHLTYEELVDKAVLEELDFIAVTDHNNYAQNKRITTNEDVTVIPGVEWTHYLGHANFIGNHRPIADPFCVDRLDRKAVKELFLSAKKNGALSTINHPFCPNCGWHFDIDETPADLIEVWNGGLAPAANRMALDWWQKKLNNGEVIRITGGSDYHKTASFRNLGQPALGVWAESNGPSDIIEAIKRGRSFVAYDCYAPSVMISSGDSHMGDCISYSNATNGESSKILVTLMNVAKNDKISIITNISHEEVTVEDHYQKLVLPIEPTEDWCYVRIEIARDPFSAATQFPIVISNPLFIKD